jgi:hypothetical protein
MNPKVFADTWSKIKDLGGNTLVDGQDGLSMDEVFEKLQEGAARPGAPGGLVTQNSYQATQDYIEASTMGQPVFGRRPKCNFHVTTEPIGQLSVIYI